MYMYRYNVLPMNIDECLCYPELLINPYVPPPNAAELSGPSPLPSALAILLPRCSQGEVDLLENVLETLEVLVNKNGMLRCVCSAIVLQGV